MLIFLSPPYPQPPSNPLKIHIIQTSWFLLIYTSQVLKNSGEISCFLQNRDSISPIWSMLRPDPSHWSRSQEGRWRQILRRRNIILWGICLRRGLCMSPRQWEARGKEVLMPSRDAGGLVPVVATQPSTNSGRGLPGTHNSVAQFWSVFHKFSEKVCSKIELWSLTVVTCSS